LKKTGKATVCVLFIFILTIFSWLVGIISSSMMLIGLFFIMILGGVGNLVISSHENNERKKQIVQERNEATRKMQIEAQETARKMQIEAQERGQIDREKKLATISNYEIAGKYEEAARLCDELEMWEKAGELRRKAKTSYTISTSFSMGKDGAISVNCPVCGSSKIVESKTNLVKCLHCGNDYIIPKKVIDMM
jgi:hypothetical protein